MTAIRRMWADKYWEMDNSPAMLPEPDENIFVHPVLVMTPEAAEELFQAARKIYSSGEGTNSYEYESARDYLATLEKEIGNG